jgi:FkbM family methyltransferase
MFRLIRTIARNILLALGVVFAVCFALSGQFRNGVPGYATINDCFYLLWGNLNFDLREGFIWFDKTVQPPDLGAFADQCKITGFEDGVVRWSSPIGTFWVTAEEGPVSLRDMSMIIQREVYKYKGRTVKPGDVVLDCGAHLGSVTRFALSKGAQLVIAIEPSAEKIVCLKKTFSPEIAAGKVRVLQVGVWSKADRLWLAGRPSLGNSVVGPGKPGEGVGEWIRVETIDQLVTEQALPRVDDIVMDIEGAETDALRGARETIRKFHPFLAIATEHTDDIAHNVRNVIGAVKESNVDYKIGFGRYGHTERKPYAPMETFFYQ